MSDRKPANYHDRRRWQDAARARGEVPLCGRGVCLNLADPAWVNHGTPLLYCTECAQWINRYNPGLCTPETPQHRDVPALRARVEAAQAKARELGDDLFHQMFVNLTVDLLAALDVSERRHRHRDDVEKDMARQRDEAVQALARFRQEAVDAAAPAPSNRAGSRCGQIVGALHIKGIDFFIICSRPARHDGACPPLKDEGSSDG